LNTGGHANASGLGQTFQPSRDVHPVTENVAVLHNDIAHVDAHSKFDALFEGDLCIALGHRGLNLSRTPHGIDNTGELDQQAITGRLDDAAPVFSNFRVYNFRPDRPEPVESAFLISPNQP
jgi:hypothetical protein